MSILGKPIIIFPYHCPPGCYGRLLALVRSLVGYVIMALIGFGLGFVVGAR